VFKSFSSFEVRAKVLEIEVRAVDTLTMTVTADSKKRVVLAAAKPGDRFDVRIAENGPLILAKLGPVPARPAQVTVEKRSGFSVGILDQPIDEEALKEALAGFP